MKESIHLLSELLQLSFPKRDICERAGGQKFIFDVNIRIYFKKGHVREAVADQIHHGE